MQVEQNFWRKCSTCKKPINFNSVYYECSVSTCTGLRTGYVFCGVSCWESHLPGARHRDAAAIEKRSPTAAQAAAQNASQDTAVAASSSVGGVRRIISSAPSQARPAGPQVPRETLIVVSKLKDYIKARADMNTSADVIDILSEKVRILCDEAIDQARADGRKTVMERDFKK